MMVTRCCCLVTISEYTASSWVRESMLLLMQMLLLVRVVTSRAADERSPVDDGKQATMADHLAVITCSTRTRTHC